MNPDPILILENVCAGYGPVQVLHGVSLTVGPGEAVAMIGSNGAGKTTTLQVISGILKPRQGRVLFDGSDCSAFKAHQLVARGLVQVPEGRKIFSRMTVLENLELGAYLRNDSAAINADFERVFQLFPVLADRRSQLGGTLSGGEQQMLAIGRAMMSRPKLMLLDEPSMGVAPLLTQKIFEALAELNRSGMAMLLVEQNAHLALGLAGRGYVLELGASVLSDQSAALLSNPRVREAYLGE